ncbi:MAG: formyltransferase family protein [Phycisphaerales bacterium]|nr:formyltransferase family protein [Phycisphaerales bacterium]
MSEETTQQSSDKLRVVFVTEDDPLYVIKFFEVFFDEYPADQIEIVGVSVQEAFHEPKWKTAKRIFNFYGPIDFFRLLARYFKVKLRGDSIVKLAKSKGLPIVDCGSVNDPAYIDRIKEINPDVVASVAAPEIFKKGILDSPKIGCINIHSGKLPIYRGMMPNFWQLLHGEQHAVVTVHEMVEKLDAGDILGTLEWPLKEHDSLDRVITGTKQDGARLMMGIMLKMKSGEAETTPLDMSTKKYFRFPQRKDVKAFRKRGHRMI